MQSPRSLHSSQTGSTLIEVVLAMGVLVVGALGAAGVFTSGMQRATSSPGDLIATQKAAEAIESVIAARDTHKLTWSQIRNARGASGSDGGVFLDDEHQLRDAGPDGLINTVDDGDVEEIRYPGPDRIMQTADDRFAELGQFRREIAIKDDPGCTNPATCGLRIITVTVTYPAGPQTREYKLTTYISNQS